MESRQPMGATRSIIIVAVAALFALIAALLVGRLMVRPAKPQPTIAAAPSKPMAQVLVAHRDLAVGTALASGDLAWQAWPADALNPSFITDGRAPQPVATGTTGQLASSVTRVANNVVTPGPMDAIYGAIVREPILANEPVTNAKLVRGGEGGFMAVVVRPGMRAMSVPITSATAAGGFILPGDRVDVLQSHPGDNNGSPGHNGPVAQVLLRNVRVLAIDQTTKTPHNASSVIGAVATLEVPAPLADVIVKAKSQGEVVLALRSYSDARGPTLEAPNANTTAGVVLVYRDAKATEVTVSP
jgi:pilus assembly protein CpaB